MIDVLNSSITKQSTSLTLSWILGSDKNIKYVHNIEYWELMLKKFFSPRSAEKSHLKPTLITRKLFETQSNTLAMMTHLKVSLVENLSLIIVFRRCSLLSFHLISLYSCQFNEPIKTYRR